MILFTDNKYLSRTFLAVQLITGWSPGSVAHQLNFQNMPVCRSGVWLLVQTNEHQSVEGLALLMTISPRSDLYSPRQKAPSETLPSPSPSSPHLPFYISTLLVIYLWSSGESLPPPHYLTCMSVVEILRRGYRYIAHVCTCWYEALEAWYELVEHVFVWYSVFRFHMWIFSKRFNFLS